MRPGRGDCRGFGLSCSAVWIPVLLSNLLSIRCPLSAGMCIFIHCQRYTPLLHFPLLLLHLCCSFTLSWGSAQGLCLLSEPCATDLQFCRLACLTRFSSVCFIRKVHTVLDSSILLTAVHCFSNVCSSRHGTTEVKIAL